MTKNMMHPSIEFQNWRTCRTIHNPLSATAEEGNAGSLSARMTSLS